MALTINLTPGYVYTDNEVDTAAKRNLLGKPTIALEGSIGTLALADGAVTTPKLVDGVLSADATGRAKMADGFLSADATGRAKVADGFLTAAKAEETFREGVAQYAAGLLSGGVYAITLSPAATAYTAGMRVVFKPDTVSAGGESINVNGLGAKALQSQGVAIVQYQLKAGQVVSCVYDGTAFQIENGIGEYTSAEAAISASQIMNEAHGLGVVPRQVRFVLRCKTTEANYSVGDEVDASLATVQVGNNENHVFWGGVSATNVFCYCISATFYLANKTTGSVTPALTAANWRVVAYVWR
jgi:hypothetical protein